MGRMLSERISMPQTLRRGVLSKGTVERGHRGRFRALLQQLKEPSDAGADQSRSSKVKGAS